MSDICEHETFRDICGVCHRNTIIEKQETEITALRAVNDALSEQMMTMIDNAGKVAALRAEVERLTKRVQELEGQHKGLVLTNSILRQRPDLPVDRIPAAAEVAALRVKNERLRKAMGDARVVWGEARDCLLTKITEVSADNERLRAVLAEAEAVALKYGEAFKRPISSYGEGFSDCSNAIADHFRRTALTSQKETSDD